jgi:predicted outer membrane protein
MFPTQTIPPLCLFLLLGGCAETNDYPMTSYRNATDLQFQTAASYDNFDVLNDGTIAVQVAASAAVRDYAVELMTDRRAAQAALKKIADSVNQQLPQQPESGDLDRLLVGLPGSALDTIYLRETMMDQDSAITLYRNEIANGSYVGLIHYAALYMPLIVSRRGKADSLLRVLEGH